MHSYFYLSHVIGTDLGDHSRGYLPAGPQRDNAGDVADRSSWEGRGATAPDPSSRHLWGNMVGTSRKRPRLTRRSTFESITHTQIIKRH